MATTKYKGEEVELAGHPVEVGQPFPDFMAVDTNLAERRLSDFQGRKVILNIFPSVDTRVCANSVRRFNQEAVALEDTVVLNISADLPFAHERFLDREGLANVLSLSLFRSPEFGERSGLGMASGVMQGLMSRAVYVLDAKGTVVYRELVADITQQPRYQRAIQALQ